MTDEPGTTTSAAAAWGGHDDVAQITREELQARIAQGGLALLEVLPVGYWRKAHLPGALSVPPDQVKTLVPQLVPDQRAEIVVYCWDFT